LRGGVQILSPFATQNPEREELYKMAAKKKKATKKKK
jgi:hypothetical protein